MIYDVNGKAMEMTDDSILKNAPAVFGQSAIGEVSERYDFVATTEIVEIVKQQGWYVVSATQQKAISKYAYKATYKKHMLRFRNDSMLMENGNIPEIVLVNSHDRTATFQFYLGLFRLVCSNGLVVPAGEIGHINVRHIKIHDTQVFEVMQTLMTQFQRVFPMVEQMRKIMLTDSQRVDFAKEAIALRWKESILVEPQAVLMPRRSDDSNKDLWSTMNVVQENLMKGGVKVCTEDNKTRSARPIKNIDRDLNINLGIWGLAEKLVSQN